MIENNNKFIMPAEWEEHAATWLAWPNDDDYFGERIKKIENKYIEIIQYLHKDELIKLIVIDQKAEDRVSGLLQKNNIDLSRIIFFQTEYVDVWIRDYGPTFVKNNDGQKVLIKWEYDAYDYNFPELFRDNEVFLNLKEKIGLDMIEPKISMDGGAIDVNGLGTLLTTKECLVHNNNIDNAKKQYEEIFKNTLGISNVIWLNKGLFNDHTEGHIDEVARFVSPNKILISSEEDPSDENYGTLKENYEILEKSIDQDGNKFEIVKIPVPHMQYENNEKQKGKKAPVAYVNFYIGNKTVLVPIFNQVTDEYALSAIRESFPDRRVVGIDSEDLVYGGGTFHCITQQEPK